MRKQTARCSHSSVDDDLIASFNAGDEKAFDLLYNCYHSYVRSIVSQLIPWQEREDVLQNVWLGVFKNLHLFQGEAAFKTWLTRIARNYIADYYRRQRILNRQIIMSEPPDSRQVILESDLEMYDLLAHIPNQLGRVACTQRFMDGKTLAEVSREEDIEYEMCRSAYRRGIEFLRGEVQQWH